MSKHDFTVLQTELRLAEAEEISLNSGLALPKGSGRYSLIKCDHTQVKRLVLAAQHRAGRTTHKACCDKTLAVNSVKGFPESPNPTLQVFHTPPGTTRLLLLHKARHFRPPVLPVGGPTSNVTIRVTTADAERAWPLPPEGIAWLKWWDQVQLDPENAPNPPTPRAASELRIATQQATAALTHFIQSTAALLPDLVSKETQALAAATYPRRGVKPKLVPNLLWGGDALPVDWSQTPPRHLQPEQVAALALLALEWSATAPPGTDPEDPRLQVVHLYQIAKPPNLGTSARPWFKEIRQDSSSTPATTLTTPLGRIVAVEDYDHLELCYRPRKNYTLPSNFADLPCRWNWGSTVEVVIEWPETWRTLPELG